MSNEPDSVLELSVKAERADETANEIKNDNSSSRNTGATESEEVKGEDYIVEISGKRTDGAYTASKYNNLINLIFSCAAVFIIPLNWYKNKEEAYKT